MPNNNSAMPHVRYIIDVIVLNEHHLNLTFWIFFVIPITGKRQKHWPMIINVPNESWNDGWMALAEIYIRYTIIKY